jgi:hypothetical protein
MFIDEGFGSLDSKVLELSVRTLSEIARRNRIIGIIPLNGTKFLTQVQNFSLLYGFVDER